MAKLTLSDVSNLAGNPTSAQGTINSNSDLTEIALENTLSRDGTSPNAMEADLDMDSNRILNLPEPVASTEPVRLGDLDALVNGSTIFISDLLDVTITDPQEDDFLRYDATLEKWVNEQAGGAGSAPDTVDYLVKTASGSLTAERVVTDNTSITFDWGTAGQVKAIRAALTGDVTASANSNALTIANDAVTYAKMQNISSTDRLLGRDTAGSGDPEELTVSGGIEFSGSGGIRTAAFTGDVTKAAGGVATTIANDAVTFAKMQDVAADRILGRITSGTGDVEALTGAEAGGLIDLDELANVDFTGVATGDVVQFDGTNWSNAPAGAFGAPSTADYLVKTADAGLTAERAVGDSTSVVADWATPGAVTFKRAALTGDVTASADSNSTTIANDAVTYAKMQDVAAASRLLGRGSAGGAGNVEELTVSSPLAISGTALTLATLPVSLIIAASDETTAITASADKVKFRMPHAMTVTAVRASLTTAQATDGAGGIFTVDINETGSGSILGTKITIDNTELTSTTAAPATITDATLADDAEITIDVDQVGDGTAKGLKVYLIGTRAA